jgi:diguanylate cyclase (GGDEF)-like protein
MLNGWKHLRSISLGDMIRSLVAAASALRATAAAREQASSNPARDALQARLQRQHELTHEREEELRARNLQFDMAINNMSQGLCFFDGAQRLIVCNRRYVDMYDLDPERIRPGITLREIIELRFAAGSFPAMSKEDYQRWRNNIVVADKPSDTIVELKNGRVFEIHHRPMPDHGWVATHEDVTERRRLRADLETSKGELEAQNQLLKLREQELKTQNVNFDAALANMWQGLAMFDADQRILVANHRFAELYDLTPEQVKPGTSLRQVLEYRIAKGHYPDKTVDEVLEATRHRVEGRGSTQYVNELGDGRLVAVTARPMVNGGHVVTLQDVTEQRRSEAKIAHMALHDALTGLANRTLLNERLEQALARTKRDEIVAAHILDLDHFKHVNDTLGHPAGDQLLKKVADRLRTLVRETDTIARMGGDEFALVQVAISEPADANALAHRIIEEISRPYDIDGQQVVIGTSVGIAIGPVDGNTTEQLIRNADLALYRAKGDGRGTFSFFAPEMDAQMQARRAMECDLRKALQAGEFELRYQPVVNLASKAIAGFEALIRWHHPEKGMVAPDQFIPMAEEIGLIIPIGEWVIRQACMTAARWPGHLNVAVNLSPVQFQSPGLLQVVVNALAASGLAPGRLELEITETILLQDSEATLVTLFRLRELGVRIAMDDFGKGYSSLAYLQRFPFDKIKIDRSFVKDIAQGGGSLKITRAVAALAGDLGMVATIEGIETREQLDASIAAGCTEMQGFLFSRPLPVHEIERQFLSQWLGDDIPRRGTNAA